MHDVASDKFWFLIRTEIQDSLSVSKTDDTN